MAKDTNLSNSYEFYLEKVRKNKKRTKVARIIAIISAIILVITMKLAVSTPPDWWWSNEQLAQILGYILLGLLLVSFVIFRIALYLSLILSTDREEHISKAVMRAISLNFEGKGIPPN